MSINCEICGKEFKTPQGLGGHKYIIHSDTGSGQRVARQATQQAPSSLGTQVTTEQKLSHLENSCARLEQVTEVRETDELEKPLGITDILLAKLLSQLTGSIEALARAVTGQQLSNPEKGIGKNETFAELLDKLPIQISDIVEHLNNRLTALETTDFSVKRMTRLCPYCDNFSVKANTKAAENKFLNEHLRQQHPDKPLRGDNQTVIRQEDGSERIIADRYVY